MTSQTHLVALGALAPLELERAPQHLPVERPGEAAVAGDDDERDALDRRAAAAARDSGTTTPRAPCRPSAPASGRRTAASPRCAPAHGAAVPPATSSSAFVILRVFLTDVIRRRMSWRMPSDAAALSSWTLKRVLELLDLGVQLLGEIVRQVAGLADLLVDRALGTQVSRSSSWKRGTCGVGMSSRYRGSRRRSRRPAPPSATGRTAAG